MADGPTGFARACGCRSVPGDARGAYGGVGFPDGEDIVMRRLVAGREPGPPLMRQKISRSLAGLTYVSGQPQMASDPGQDSRVNREMARRLGLRSIVCSPLQIRG